MFAPRYFAPLYYPRTYFPTGGDSGTSSLSPGDLAAIATAVWGKIIENGLSAQEIYRVLLAFAAGDVTGGPSAPKFWSQDGSKIRFEGTADVNGNRTRTYLDGT